MYRSLAGEKQGKPALGQNSYMEVQTHMREGTELMERKICQLYCQ